MTEFPRASGALSRRLPWSRTRHRRSASKSHRNDIQGLRAVAILLVVLDHAGVGFMQGGFIGVDVFFVLSGFLITGLLLSGARSKGSVSLWNFYVRRGRRILPAAALTLIVTDIVAYDLLNFVRAKTVAQDSVWASVFAANIHFANVGTDYFGRSLPPSPIQHFWSLAVEEQFYLVWPLILGLTLFGIRRIRRSALVPAQRRKTVDRRAMRRLGVAITLIALASLAWSISATKTQPASAFFSTFARAWELALGAGLAICASRLRLVSSSARAALGWLGLVAIGIAGVSFSASTPIPGYASLLPTIGAVLVIGAGLGEEQSRWAVARALAAAPLRYIGDRSYTFYLWHWPVLIIADQYEGQQLSVVVKLLLLVGAFLLSMFTYKFFENPIRRGEPIGPGIRSWVRHRLRPYGIGSSRSTITRPVLSPRHLAIWPVSILAVLVVASLLVSSIDNKATQLEAAAVPATPGFTPQQVAAIGHSVGSAQTLPAVIAAVQAARRRAPIPAGLSPPVGELLNPSFIYSFPAGCAPSELQTTSQICRLGSASGAKSIVVMGDSHAQMWMPTILAMANQDGWIVRPIVKSGCSPYTWVDKFGTAACRAWYQWAVRQVKALHPDAILVGGAYGGLGGAIADAVKNGLTAYTAAVKSSAKAVVLIADNDGIGAQPVDCLLARGATMATCTSSRTVQQLQLNDDLAGTATVTGLRYLRTRGWFCFEAQCPMVVGHTIVYRDLGHITNTYAGELAGPFRTAFRQAITNRPPANGNRGLNPVSSPPSARTIQAELVAAVEAARRGAHIPPALTPPASELLNISNPQVWYTFPSGCAPTSDIQSTSFICRLGGLASSRSIVVIGDSHAQMWMPAILAMAAQAGWLVRPIVKSGCSPNTWVDHFGNPACRDWYNWAVAQVKTIRPQVVLIGADYAGSGGSPAQMHSALDGLTALTSVAKRGSRVVLLADTEALGKEPVDCLLAPGASMASCTVTRTPELGAFNTDLAGSARAVGYSFLDTRGWFCFAGRCPMVIGHSIVYLNRGHMTATYASQLTQPFSAAFRAATGTGTQSKGPTGSRSRGGSVRGLVVGGGSRK